MKTLNMLIATGVALGFGLGAANVQAAPILGSHVDSALFASSIGATTGWAYLGQSTSAFTISGTAEIEFRESTNTNTFGYSTTNHNTRTEIFGANAAVGSIAAVAGYSPSYLLYFASNGGEQGVFSDDNSQYTDGFATGGNPGITQGDIDIFYNAALSKWALFFDDAGGGNNVQQGDDNDYNDMVVSFTSNVASVPEPTTLGLLGLSMLGLGMLRRRKSTKGELAA